MHTLRCNNLSPMFFNGCSKETGLNKCDILMNTIISTINMAGNADNLNFQNAKCVTLYVFSRKVLH